MGALERYSKAMRSIDGASMCYHPEYAKGWNAAIAAMQAGE